MIELIKSMKNQFAESQQIQNVVGDRCKFVINLQDIREFPAIVYNCREVVRITKDNCREYDLSVFVLAKNIQDLMNVYEVAKEVMDNETTDFYSVFEGSSYPEVLEDFDDIYIIDINYKIEY